jgi:cyclic beta-1,2-glucan synthetase
MGWERKRGKLLELSRLLRGATDTSFLGNEGRPAGVPKDVRYVITLDADTRLPRGAARRLIGKMAHPLNHPRFDRRLCRVVEGYGILQPRVTPSLPTGREGSLFQRVFSSPSGLDPYASAVSDVYQDLFGEGSYCGKGIYDIDAFEASLAVRIPENTVLSHDLLEGIFARAGYASDIEVVEEFPSRYEVAAARQHRWVRGDWQLLRWIFGRGRDALGGPRCTIPLSGRWKMLDNLRRSMIAPANLLVLLLAWTMPRAEAALWTGFVLLSLALPALLPLAAALLPSQRGASRRYHLRALRRDFLLAALQIGFLIAFLAHQAWLAADAILRTLYRVVIARRRLLEWTTAAQAKSALARDPARLRMQTAYALLFSVAAALLILLTTPVCFALAAPFLLLWTLSPLIAWWASQPPALAGHLDMTPDDEQALRLIARRTWRYFEAFVTSDDAMLPPDNYQEDPNPVIAHRTSPTNLGLYLLSVATAHDFGWIGMVETLERLEATLDSMRGLERFRGHFFNWYGTKDRRALSPKYVSSVDSGNLAGHLIALANCCRAMIAEIVAGPAAFDGIGDALKLMRESAPGPAEEWRSRTVTRKSLADELDAVVALLHGPPSEPAEIAARFAALTARGTTIADMGRTLAEESELARDLPGWGSAVDAAITSHQRDLDRLMPWAAAGWKEFLGSAHATPIRGELESMFASPPTLGSLPELCEAAIGILIGHPVASGATAAEDAARIARLIDAFERAAQAARSVERRLVALARLAREMAEAMDFSFLFDAERQLLAIGYRVTEGALDPNCYDLLASEARLASFIAIAKGDVPARHWFRLGRGLTAADHSAVLLSWSGSMFEYLMPSLVMRAPTGSLMEQTNRLVVHRQISYAAERGVPWGISESQYNARDLDFTYQYSTFGIPDLAYKRGLGDDLVIAPYATGLAAMMMPKAAVANFAALAAAGGRGRYGWYEALDYTPSRLPKDRKNAVVRAFMAHHQGMILVAIADALHDGAMRRRFHAEPIIQATELLLQERMPRDVALVRPTSVDSAPAHVGTIVPPAQRRYQSAQTRTPRTHLLSNGQYTVMLTNAGSGFSRWRGLAITRWQEDPTCDPWGAYIFLRDVATGAVWSAGYQPSGTEPESYEVAFSEDRAEFVRRDGRITTTLEVAVSSPDDGEVRRVSLTNLGNRVREIEVTSYAEIVLAPQAADTAHPCYAKMFVETEHVAHLGALLATRRRQSAEEAEVWAAHMAVIEGETIGERQFETDRARFLGRGQIIRTPAALGDDWPLSNTVGAVLDPIFSLRTRLRLAPGATAHIAFWTFVAPSREQVLRVLEKHYDPTAFERVLTLAWTQAQVQLHHLGITPDEAHHFQRLANGVLYADPALRPSSNVLLRGARDRSGLWALGISGDLPIVLLRYEEPEDLDIIRELLRAKDYWRTKQLAVDLVLLNERTASYVQDLQSAVEALVRASHPAQKLEGDVPAGGTFTLRGEVVAIEHRELLQTAARVVLHGRRGSLSEQLPRQEKPPAAPLTGPGPALGPEQAAPPSSHPRLEFFNGLGGFAADGREYVTVLRERQWTPAPWVNVIANPDFGFQVSAEGAGFSWRGNSRENQITPWSNDPVSDSPSEILYLRDEESGALWGPTALPLREEGSTYVARHGQGYSRFEHSSHETAMELLQYVPREDSLKISRLKIRNTGKRMRRISVTAYVEWSLGPSRSAGSPFIATEIDSETKALLARNPWNAEGNSTVAFLDLAGRQQSWTGDRTEFIGRNGTLASPAAMSRGRSLSNRVGAGLDPCGALQLPVILQPEQSVEIVILLGAAASKGEVSALIAKYRAIDLDGVLAEVEGSWESILGAVQVKTPDRALDILLNRWLLYQTLSCRIWARAGFYQASGAYGFRDQLQDVLALVASRPDVARAHILTAAGRQFIEGDVQHWWLPASGRGVRTLFSDDRVWLPHVVALYIEWTGDHAVLDEQVPFLEGPVLKPGELESFFLPRSGEASATLFEHCALALDASLATGSHGLPLMGTGDWNDGMNRVGAGGKGESVWLGWFLAATLAIFTPIAEHRDKSERAAAWRRHLADLRDSLERNAWDGEWYRRGYFDDGTPLGASANSECRIDSIAQSWAVISGASEPARAAGAMAAVDKHLIRRNDGLALLFTPPFDHGPQDPGRIKAYPPGIRENGGQYTHAACWSVVAFAMLGEGDKAAELFSLLNPINHGNTRAGIHRYKVEPYVVAADIYSVPPHIGRGGWTWYTGSAGWMYRAAVEFLLGLRIRGSMLSLAPSIPKSWSGFSITLHYRSARYEISVENPNGAGAGIARVEVDGTSQKGTGLELRDDGATHKVRVTLG